MILMVLLGCIFLLLIQNKIKLSVTVISITITLIIILCGAVIPSLDLKYEVESLKNTDADSLQYGVLPFVIYIGWWIFGFILITIFIVGLYVKKYWDQLP